ncbi:unnamed protein product, partial [Ectocarpus sp. 12 AP-2014]
PGEIPLGEVPGRLLCPGVHAEADRTSSRRFGFAARENCALGQVGRNPTLQVLERLLAGRRSSCAGGRFPPRGKAQALRLYLRRGKINVRAPYQGNFTWSVSNTLMAALRGHDNVGYGTPAEIVA